MNYKRVYDSLIQKRRLFPINQGGEFHHIIPKACGGANTAPIPRNNHVGTNLVGLTLREHFVAHRLLMKIYSNTKYADKVNYAFQMMAFTKSDLATGEANGIRISSKEYEKLKAEHKDLVGKHTKGRVWINDGKISKRVYPQEIPVGWKFGQLKKRSNQGKILVNNGTDMRMVYPDQIPEGYKIGDIRGLNSKYYIWVTNGKTEMKVHPKLIPVGFSKGRLPKSLNIQQPKNAKLKLIKEQKITVHGKGCIIITDGEYEYRISKDQPIPEGYQRGRKLKATIWVNNGHKQMMVKPNQIPDGYVRGRLDKTTKGKVCVNNGHIMKMVYPDQIPIGYKLGMLESVCKDRKKKWFERRCHKE